MDCLPCKAPTCWSGSNWGSGVLLRDTATHPGRDRTCNLDWQTTALTSWDCEIWRSLPRVLDSSSGGLQGLLYSDAFQLEWLNLVPDWQKEDTRFLSKPNLKQSADPAVLQGVCLKLEKEISESPGQGNSPSLSALSTLWETSTLLVGTDSNIDPG